MDKKLVYVAHPYGGKSENKVRIDEVMKTLLEGYEDYVFVSPIHNFSYLYLDGDRYIEGLDYCLNLLSKANVLILAGDYASSRGCCAEYGFAKGSEDISIYTLKEWISVHEAEYQDRNN